MSFAPNRLAQEKSPYLLQHAHNPVDWFPWGQEAFVKARLEDKPIFLSIGYSTCHWCHVMEHESFESAAIAAFLAEHFVSIKVDREERPDVDQVYMTFVQATTGHGGWPMSVWLTPDLRPFFGGTYFPPTDLPGRPGFITVLRRIAELWKSERGQIEDKAASLLTALRDAEQETSADPDEEWHCQSAVRNGLTQYMRLFDGADGGFGGAPKFPRPANLQFLFAARLALGVPPTEAESARGMALHTLAKMAEGGMHDHLGGGFHRYSVDAEWHVPHFEKMLYDQAQLAQVYLTAYQVTRDPRFAEVARDIFAYVQTDLTSPAGAFFSAEDADSLPAAEAVRKLEGAFYVWTMEQLAEVLGRARAEEFAAVYGARPGGNVSPAVDPHGELAGTNVLIRRLPLPEAARRFQRTPEEMESLLSADRRALLKARIHRPRPHLDDKILTAWNGLMIGAFARGAQVLEDPTLLASAQRAARFLREQLFDAASGELRRSYREGASTVGGFASDYTFLISGLLDLYHADFDPAWLKWARQLQDTLDLHFWDQTRGGYFSTADRDPAILLRLKEDYDGAEPTPTSAAVGNLVRMGRLFHNETMLRHAGRAVQAFSTRLEAQPFGLPLLLAGAVLRETPALHLILHADDPADPALAALRTEARRRFLPQLSIVEIATPAARAFFAPLHAAVEALPEKAGAPAAYLCEEYACRLPVTSPEALREMLADY